MEKEIERRALLASLVTAPAALSLYTPQEPPYAPKQSDRPEPLNGEEPGFQSIFDGKTLGGWEGDPKYWRVQSGEMIGEITPETVIDTSMKNIAESEPVRTIRNLPNTMSTRATGLQSSVSIVPRSFSPAVRSIAGYIAPVKQRMMMRYGTKGLR